MGGRFNEWGGGVVMKTMMGELNGSPALKQQTAVERKEAGVKNDDREHDARDRDETEREEC